MSRYGKIKKRLAIVTSLYFTYSIFNSGGNTDEDEPQRLLSETMPLEFVHISHTGASEIEAMASTQASINWGACHFIKVANANCMDPDMSWYNISDAVYDQSYALHNIWLTPPAVLLDTIEEPSRNPYINKDLFTVVRNPYTRMVSEFYCSSNGYNKNRDKSDVNDPAALNGWLMQELQTFMNQVISYQQISISGDQRLANSTYATGAFSQLFKKHFTPLFRYVYDAEGERVIDKVIHFEDIKSEFKDLMAEYELEIKMPSQIKQSSGSLTHLDLYPETIALINAFFEPDFEAFGYEKVESFQERAAYSLRARAKPCVDYKYGDEECSRDAGKEIEQQDGPVPIRLPHATTFMLGIFSELTQEGARAREQIRNTYLLNPEGTNSICSWETYKNQYDSSGGRFVPCRIPYAFIVGGDPARPLEHADDEPIVIERNLLKGANDEPDMLYLNVKEDPQSASNSEKSFAFFKFASIVGPEYHLDFVASAQTSTLIDVGKLIDFVDKELPPSPLSRRIYGGETYGRIGGYYATDPFYFVSIDLAHYISKFKVKNLSSRSKTAALDIGKLISAHPKPVQYMNMNADLFWYKGLYDQSAWDDYWNFNMTELPKYKDALDTMQICNDFTAKTLLD